MSQEGQSPPDGVEFLDVGPRRGGAARLRRRAWWALLLAAAAVATALAVLAHRSTTVPVATATTGVVAVPETTAPPPKPIVIQGRPLPGARSDWQLYGRGDGVVLRIRLARGLIDRTIVPTLQSSGPVSFVAGSGWALVRPLDFVPGYVITDGRPARRARGALSVAGPALPGPDARHVWLPGWGAALDEMVLAGVDGRPTATSITLPPGTSVFEALPDQRGNVLFAGSYGVYEAAPGRRPRLLTSATLLAVGPTRLLTGACEGSAHCQPTVIDRATGAARPLRRPLDQAGQPTGVISPDGRSAALFLGSSPKRIAIIDLATGGRRLLPLYVNRSYAGWQTIAWSPDSRWLFAVAASGDLEAVDVRTGQLADLTAHTGSSRLEELAVPLAPTG